MHLHVQGQCDGGRSALAKVPRLMRGLRPGKERLSLYISVSAGMEWIAVRMLVVVAHTPALPFSRSENELSCSGLPTFLPSRFQLLGIGCRPLGCHYLVTSVSLRAQYLRSISLWERLHKLLFAFQINNSPILQTVFCRHRRVP